MSSNHASFENGMPQTEKRRRKAKVKVAVEEKEESLPFSPAEERLRAATTRRIEGHARLQAAAANGLEAIVKAYSGLPAVHAEYLKGVLVNKGQLADEVTKTKITALARVANGQIKVSEYKALMRALDDKDEEITTTDHTKS